MTVRDHPGYFLRRAEARKLLRFIHGTLAAGRRIQITTMTRSTVYSAAHAELFSAEGDRVLVRHGRRHIVLTDGWYEHLGRVYSTSTLDIRAVA